MSIWGNVKGHHVIISILTHKQLHKHKVHVYVLCYTSHSLLHWFRDGDGDLVVHFAISLWLRTVSLLWAAQEDLGLGRS